MSTSTSSAHVSACAQRSRLKHNGRIPCHQPAGKHGKLLFPPDAIERARRSEPSSPRSDRADDRAACPVDDLDANPGFIKEASDATKTQTTADRLQYFAWNLFHRAGVFYADGRGGKQSSGNIRWVPGIVMKRLAA